MNVKEFFDSLKYTDFVGYVELSEGDKNFFDKIFYLLILQGSITWSNEKLAYMLNDKISTVEKRLSRLEKAGLILRETSREKQNGVWRTVDRVIRLSPQYFSFSFNTHAHKVYCDYLYYQKIDSIFSKILEMDVDEFLKTFGKMKVVY